MKEIDPDPRAILDAWLAGTWTRFDGQSVVGHTWDDDTRYRYRVWLADGPLAWFRYIDRQVWTFEPLHVADWAGRLTNLDGTPMSNTGRARAASAVRSFYRHCEVDLGASSWRLPKRWRLVGAIAPRAREGRLNADRMRALITAADRYRGPHPERGRLATYLACAGLRVGQIVALELGHIAREDATGPKWRLPVKNNAASAVAAWSAIPRPVVLALDDYLVERTWRTPHSTQSTGTLLLSRYGRALDRITTLNLVRAVAATHPDLEEIAPTMRLDDVAHSPSPFA